MQLNVKESVMSEQPVEARWQHEPDNIPSTNLAAACWCFVSSTGTFLLHQHDLKLHAGAHMWGGAKPETWELNPEQHRAPERSQCQEIREVNKHCLLLLETSTSSPESKYTEGTKQVMYVVFRVHEEVKTLLEQNINAFSPIGNLG